MGDRRRVRTRQEILEAFGSLGLSECPRCGCVEFRTDKSYPVATGARRRRRSCAYCGLEVFTEEVPVALGRMPELAGEAAPEG